MIPLTTHVCTSVILFHIKRVRLGAGVRREVRHKRAGERPWGQMRHFQAGGESRPLGLAAEWQAAERGTSRSRQPRRQKAHHQRQRHHSGVPQVPRPEVRGSLAEEATRTSRECLSGDLGRPEAHHPRLVALPWAGHKHALPNSSHSDLRACSWTTRQSRRWALLQPRTGRFKTPREIPPHVNIHCSETAGPRRWISETGKLNKKFCALTKGQPTFYSATRSILK